MLNVLCALIGCIQTHTVPETTSLPGPAGVCGKFSKNKFDFSTTKNQLKKIKKTICLARAWFKNTWRGQPCN